MKIFEVNHGIANYFYDKNGKGFIEINRNLKKYPKLYKSVLSHELEHSKSKNKYMDIKIELKEMCNFKSEIEMLKFHFRHPKAFLQLLPVTKSHNGFYSKDNFMIMVYAILIIGNLIFIKFMGG